MPNWKDTGIKFADLKIEKKGSLRRMVKNDGEILRRYKVTD